LVLISVFITAAAACLTAKPPYLVIAYLLNGKNVNNSQLSWNDMTHVMDAFANPGPDGSFHARARNGLASEAHHNNTRCILSFGGVGDSDINWRGATSLKNQDTFIKNIMDFVSANAYDGVDIDWEFPGIKDKAAFTGFMTKLSKALHAVNGFDGKPLELMFCICPVMDYNKGYDFSALAKVVDAGIMMSYVPLKTAADSVQSAETLGFPADKMLMGIALFDGNTGTYTVKKILEGGTYINYDEAQAEASYYYNNLTLTVNTPRAVKERIKWAFDRPYPLLGIALWQASYAYPPTDKSVADIWAVVGNRDQNPAADWIIPTDTK
jgi:GH18 family chitinase